jgi:hypothetical protein
MNGTFESTYKLNMVYIFQVICTVLVVGLYLQYLTPIVWKNRNT